MPNKFSFNFYGIECRFFSQNKKFFSAVVDKFALFTNNATARLTQSIVQVRFYNLSKQFHPPIKMGNNIGFNEDKLLLRHLYLTTNTLVEVFFRRKRVNKIEFNYGSSFLFKAGSAILGDDLQRQLFHILVKFYLEQTLLWEILRVREDIACLHGASVEKDGKVLLFCGLNGVGKTTLVQILVEQYGYKFFSDNYTLITEKEVFFAPERVRVEGSKGIKFGFGKSFLRLDRRKMSSYKKAKLAAIYLLRQNKKWRKKEVNGKYLMDKILHLQIANQEDPFFAPVSHSLDKLEWCNRKIYPNCEFFELEVGSLAEFSLDKII